MEENFKHFSFSLSFVSNANKRFELNENIDFSITTFVCFVAKENKRENC